MYQGLLVVVQWLRIHFPKQGTQVRALISKEVPHALGQLSPHCNY